MKIEGFNVANTEFLLALKQGAELERKESSKGEKDRIDIISMLLKCDIDFKKYKRLLKENSREDLFSRLITILKTFDQPDYFSMNPRQFKTWKKSTLSNMKNA